MEREPINPFEALKPDGEFDPLTGKRKKKAEKVSSWLTDVVAEKKKPEKVPAVEKEAGEKPKRPEIEPERLEPRETPEKPMEPTEVEMEVPDKKDLKEPELEEIEEHLELSEEPEETEPEEEEKVERTPPAITTFKRPSAAVPIPPIPPPTPPPVAPPPTGGGSGPSIPTSPNIIPPTPNIAPNLISDAEAIDARRANFGAFLVGALVGGTIEHIRHKRRERRMERERKEEIKKVSAEHDQTSEALRTDIDREKLHRRRIEGKLERQPVVIPETVVEKEKEVVRQDQTIKTAPYVVPAPSPEVKSPETAPEEQLRPVEYRPAPADAERPKPVIEASPEFGSIERRDTTPETLTRQQTGQDLGARGGGAAGWSAPGVNSQTQPGLVTQQNTFSPQSKIVDRQQPHKPPVLVIVVFVAMLLAAIGLALLTLL